MMRHARRAIRGICRTLPAARDEALWASEESKGLPKERKVAELPYALVVIRRLLSLRRMAILASLAPSAGPSTLRQNSSRNFRVTTLAGAEKGVPQAGRLAELPYALTIEPIGPRQVRMAILPYPLPEEPFFSTPVGARDSRIVAPGQSSSVAFEHYYRHAP